MISLIAAMTRDRVIGRDGRIPWKIPGEQAYFKRVTWGHPVAMGRKTYESIGRPLPGRTNYVLSQSRDFQPPGCVVVDGVQPLLSLAEGEEIFVIGGARVFETFLPWAERMYLTLIDANIRGDTVFPPYDANAWTLLSSVEGSSPVPPHRYDVYTRKRSPTPAGTR